MPIDKYKMTNEPYLKIHYLDMCLHTVCFPEIENPHCENCLHSIYSSYNNDLTQYEQ